MAWRFDPEVLDAVDNGNPCCVRCGKLLKEEDIQFCANAGRPPHCVPCGVPVMREIRRNTPMWPSAWKGGAYKDAAGDWWIV